jgi:ubiquinone/menaquinone biosynthesis C-methylase UbiE
LSDTERNVGHWTQVNADYAPEQGRRAWTDQHITWGMFGAPEAELEILGDVDGLDVVELGCGTADFSAWLARAGARPVGVDPTPAQLDTAPALQGEFGIEFPLVEAGAEDVPLPDHSFDLALSEHGASTWCDPERWLPEAARLLRSGGRLVFMHMSPLTTICFPDQGQITTRLLRPYFGLRRFEWTPDGEVEFQLTYGGWVDVLRRSGFEVERLVEVQPPAAAETHAFYSDIPVEWARHWPAEEIWVARRR